MPVLYFWLRIKIIIFWLIRTRWNIFLNNTHVSAGRPLLLIREDRDNTLSFVISSITRSGNGNAFVLQGLMARVLLRISWSILQEQGYRQEFLFAHYKLQGADKNWRGKLIGKGLSENLWRRTLRNLKTINASFFELPLPVAFEYLKKKKLDYMRYRNCMVAGRIHIVEYLSLHPFARFE